MAAGRARPQQHQRRPRRLQARCHLARLHGVHARVVGPGQEQHRGIGARVRCHAVVRGVGEHGPELDGVLHRPVLRDVERAVRRQLRAQHVVDADVRDHRPEEVGPLHERRAHEQAAVAAAFDGKASGARVARADQVLGAGDEVVEDVLLPGERARAVPVLAELRSPAQVGQREDSAAVQPHPQAGVEVRRLADPVAAVSREQRRVRAVEPRALAAHDAHGHARAVA